MLRFHLTASLLAISTHRRPLVALKEEVSLYTDFLTADVDSALSRF